MSEAQRILNLIAEEKEMSPDVIADAMNKIAYHESWDSDKRMGIIPNRVQTGGGPGRGAFQYEIGKGKSAEVGLNRIKAFYKDVLKEEPPEWVQELPIDYNPAELDLDQQQVLFLADHRMRPRSDFKKLEKMDVDEWWGKYHQTKNDPSKRVKFRNHAELYEADLLGGPGFQDIPVPPTEPGRLDFELPPMPAQPAEEPQVVSEDEVMGRQVYLDRLF
jgi:hypothetical protein